MDIPIQLKFFKKLELYQEILFEDRKYEDQKRIDPQHIFESWNIEKNILTWTRRSHHHLGSELTEQRIRDDILKGKHSHEHQHAMANLVQRGFATLYPDNVDPVRPPAIRITKEGLLVGELLTDIADGKDWTYSWCRRLAWITVMAGVIIVIDNAVKVIWPLVKEILCRLNS